MWYRQSNVRNVSFGLRKIKVAIIWLADVDISSVINVVASTTVVNAEIYVVIYEVIFEK